MRAPQTRWSTLVFGLILAGGGVLLVTNGVGLVTRLDWIVPIFLILVALGLFASAFGDRPRRMRGPYPAMPPAPGGGAPGSGTPRSGAAESSGAGASPGEPEPPGGAPLA